MADYLLNGTRTLKSYMKTNGFDDNRAVRVAGALNIPIIHLNGAGKDPASFKRRITLAQAENVASLLGTSVANLVTNAGLVQLP